MGCVTSIAIALWLIAFAAGVMLLYKVQKENLQWPFKVAGWLIVIVALGGMLCCSLRCICNSSHGEQCGRPPMMMYHDEPCKTHDKECKNCSCCCCCCKKNISCDEECEHNIFAPFDLENKTEQEFYEKLMKRYFEVIKDENIIGKIEYKNHDLRFDNLSPGAFTPSTTNKIVCKGPASKELSGCIYAALKMYKCVMILLEKDGTYTVYTCENNPQ